MRYQLSVLGKTQGNCFDDKEMDRVLFCECSKKDFPN